MNRHVFGRFFATGVLVVAVASCSGPDDLDPMEGLDPLASVEGMILLAGSLFDGDDGNLKLDDTTEVPGGGTDVKDWENAPAAGFPTFAWASDLVGSQSDDSFGQGAKEDDPDPSITAGSIPPQKSDLKRFYIAGEPGTVDPDGAGPLPAETHTFVYLAWIRSNVLGTANMDFELNRLATLKPSGNPDRQAGDVLITFDWSGGGKEANLGLLKWITTGPDSQCHGNGAKVPCWGAFVDLDASGFARGAVNFDEGATKNASDDGFAVLDPVDPDGAGPLPAFNETLAPKTFGEAEVDITAALGLDPNQCLSFALASLHTRSSDSFTSELKDRIAPIPSNLNFCQPANIKVRKVDAVSGTPLAGAQFTLYNDLGTHGVYDAGVDTVATVDSAGSANPCTTGSNGICEWQVSGSGTNHYLVRETAAPPNYIAFTGVLHVDVTFNASVQNIDLGDVNNARAPRDLTLLKQDDDNPANPVQGAVFVLFLDAGGDGVFGAAERTAGAISGKTCTSAATGLCTITNVDTGFKYWVVENSIPSGYSVDSSVLCETATGVFKACRLVDVPVGSGTIGPTGLTFTNPREFVVITLVCQKNTDGTTVTPALYPSQVSLDGVGPLNTIGLVPAGLAGKGVTAADLCGIGGARFEPKAASATPYQGSVTIPQ